MAKPKKPSRAKRDLKPGAALTRADRLEAIGNGEPDPCANDETVITRATRLDAIGEGEPDPCGDLMNADAVEA
jgi:hypothetical protein